MNDLNKCYFTHEIEKNQTYWIRIIQAHDGKSMIIMI